MDGTSLGIPGINLEGVTWSVAAMLACLTAALTLILSDLLWPRHRDPDTED